MKISKSEFAARRKRLMAEMAPNSVAIIPAAREVTRSRDTEYPFRQNSDFFYLTGFQEPEGILVLIPGRRQGQVIMFCRDRDPERELWDGYRQGPEGVVKNFGMNDAYPVSSDFTSFSDTSIAPSALLGFTIGKRPKRVNLMQNTTPVFRGF